MSDKPVKNSKKIKNTNFLMASQKKAEEQKKKMEEELKRRQEEDVKKKLTSPVKKPLNSATPLPKTIISLDDEMEEVQNQSPEKILSQVPTQPLMNIAAHTQQ